ncbi:MAG: type VI secretion system-associated protein TagO [Mesorhizobium sp.]
MEFRTIAAAMIAAKVFTVSPGYALDITGCIRTENDLDRLACYDKASGRRPVAVTAQSKGKWILHTEKSAMTDQATVVLSLESNESPNCGWNKGAKINLVLRCMENRTVAYFDTGCHMTSSDYNSYGDIQYRVDDAKAVTVGGNASTDNRSLGLWSGGKSVPFIKRLIGKTKLTARMTPYGESPFTASFDIGGLEGSLEPLRKACGW